MRWRSFVAVGDSFSEGMDDPYPDGTYRGWADLVATRLAAEAGPDFGYANLAIRGRLFRHVVDDQVPVALEMKPDLISFAAGGNDALRRELDSRRSASPASTTVVRRAARRRRRRGALPLRRRDGPAARQRAGSRPRWSQMLNPWSARPRERHGAILVDLYSDDTFLNPMLWSTGPAAPVAGRAPPGRRAGADRARRRLRRGVAAGAPAPGADAVAGSARTADLRWAGKHLAPWVKRRLTGRSSGDTVTAKRPMLGAARPTDRADSPHRTAAAPPPRRRCRRAGRGPGRPATGSSRSAPPTS